MNLFLRAFQAFIRENHLFLPEDNVLLAVSGGLDSMVMARLFAESGFRFGIAHCNFGLRGPESDEDELFVTRFAGKKQVPFHPIRFNTKKHAARHHLSVQMAARELRYSWFEEIRSTHGYNYVSTAHHLDDQAETFLINLIRGTGISGLHGILPKRDTIIRPMLFTDRKAISQYAVSQGIGFREDRSNNETKYLRNRIRHEIMPHILSANPDFLKSISTTAGQVRKIEGFWNENLCRIRQAIIHESEDVIFIDFRQLTSLESPSLVAWEILSPYGFTASAIRDILASVSRDSGRKFLSKTHRLIKDRDNLIITKIKNGKGTKSEYSIDLNAGPGLERNDLPVPLRIHEENIRNDFSIPVSPTIACLDRNKIGSSLILRKWRSGDTFYPLGMNRKKKLSDFFIDIKLSIPAKENTWLLCTGDKIVWVVGLRMDNRFRITGRSKRILRVEMI